MAKILKLHHIVRMYRFSELYVNDVQTWAEKKGIHTLGDDDKATQDEFQLLFRAEEDAMDAVLADVYATIKRCAAFDSNASLRPISCSDFYKSGSGDSVYVSSQDSSPSSSTSSADKVEVEERSMTFEDSIFRATPASSNNTSLKFSHWRNGSVERLLLDNIKADSSSSTTAQHTGRRESSNHRGTASAQEASEALDALTSCFLSIDQMLQLRFQMKGSAHFETLVGNNPNRDPSSPKAKEIEKIYLNIDKNKDKGELMTPAAVYEVADSLTDLLTD